MGCSALQLRIDARKKSILGFHLRKVSQLTGYSVDLHDAFGKSIDEASLSLSESSESSSRDGQSHEGKPGASSSHISMVRNELVAEFENNADHFAMRHKRAGVWVEIHHDELKKTVYFNTETYDLLFKRPKDWVRLMRQRYDAGDSFGSATISL